MRNWWKKHRWAALVPVLLAALLLAGCGSGAADGTTENGTGAYHTDPVPEGKPQPVEPGTAEELIIPTSMIPERRASRTSLPERS